MNLLEKICQELGVEIGEEWEGNDGKTYVIKDKRIIEYYEPESYSDTDYEGWVVSGYEVYADILQGKLEPVKKTALWKPEMNELYYMPFLHIDPDERFLRYIWKGNVDDYKRYRTGTVVRTEQEAIELTNRMLVVVKGDE